MLDPEEFLRLFSQLNTKELFNLLHPSQTLQNRPLLTRDPDWLLFDRLNFPSQLQLLNRTILAKIYQFYFRECSEIDLAENGGPVAQTRSSLGPILSQVTSAGYPLHNLVPSSARKVIMKARLPPELAEADLGASILAGFFKERQVGFEDSQHGRRLTRGQKRRNELQRASLQDFNSGEEPCYQLEYKETNFPKKFHRHLRGLIKDSQLISKEVNLSVEKLEILLQKERLQREVSYTEDEAVKIEFMKMRDKKIRQRYLDRARAIKDTITSLHSSKQESRDADFGQISTIPNNSKEQTEAVKKLHPSVQEMIHSRSCLICNEIEATEENPILYCDVCQGGFHISCYGLTEPPKSSVWVCDLCKAHRKAGVAVKCQLCPNKGGCLKMVKKEVLDDLGLATEGLDANTLSSSEVKAICGEIADQDTYNAYLEVYRPTSVEGPKNYQWVHVSCLVEKVKDRLEQKMESGGLEPALSLNTVKRSSTPLKGSKMDLLKSLHKGSSSKQARCSPKPQKYPSTSKRREKDRHNHIEPFQRFHDPPKLTAPKTNLLSSPNTKKAKKVRKCYICDKSSGYLVKCKQKDCHHYFHPECARRVGLPRKDHLGKQILTKELLINFRAHVSEHLISHLETYEVDDRWIKGKGDILGLKKSYFCLEHGLELFSEKVAQGRRRNQQRINMAYIGLLEDLRRQRMGEESQYGYFRGTVEKRREQRMLELEKRSEKAIEGSEKFSDYLDIDQELLGDFVRERVLRSRDLEKMMFMLDKEDDDWVHKSQTKKEAGFGVEDREDVVKGDEKHEGPNEATVKHEMEEIEKNVPKNEQKDHKSHKKDPSIKAEVEALRRPKAHPSEIMEEEDANPPPEEKPKERSDPQEVNEDHEDLDLIQAQLVTKKLKIEKVEKKKITAQKDAELEPPRKGISTRTRVNQMRIKLNANQTTKRKSGDQKKIERIQKGSSAKRGDPRAFLRSFKEKKGGKISVATKQPKMRTSSRNHHGLRSKNHKKNKKMQSTQKLIKVKKVMAKRANNRRGKMSCQNPSRRNLGRSFRAPKGMQIGNSKLRSNLGNVGEQKHGSSFHTHRKIKKRRGGKVSTPFLRSHQPQLRSHKARGLSLRSRSSRKEEIGGWRESGLYQSGDSDGDELEQSKAFSVKAENISRSSSESEKGEGALLSNLRSSSKNSGKSRKLKKSKRRAQRRQKSLAKLKVSQAPLVRITPRIKVESTAKDGSIRRVSYPRASRNSKEGPIVTRELDPRKLTKNSQMVEEMIFSAVEYLNEAIIEGSDRLRHARDHQSALIQKVEVTDLVPYSRKTCKRPSLFRPFTNEILDFLVALSGKKQLGFWKSSITFLKKREIGKKGGEVKIE